MAARDESVAVRENSERTRLTIRHLEQGDLDTADEVMRMAFGTYLNAPNPVQVFGDSDYVHTRFRADPARAFCAELDSEIVGSNFVTRWGSFAFFGPLTVRVDLWDQGIASRLMEPVMNLFEKWDVRQAGLFTFPESPKHVRLYQKFGFRPQELTPLLEKSVDPPGESPAFSTYSQANDDESREANLGACRQLADQVFSGLDLEGEIVAAGAHEFGDTVLVREDGEVAAFAVCHCGGGTEAGSGTCFIKFGAARPGDGDARRFEHLLDACESFAADRGLERIVAGCNTARHGAYEALLGRGFRAFLNGLAMLRPNEPGYNRADAWVIDDLR
jgi:GNAT superfamily N-acetyltransferase